MQLATTRTTIALFVVLTVVLAACEAAPAPIISPSGAQPLPTPASVGGAALANLRPLTTSGGARFGVWTPDGLGLVFAESDQPLLPIALLDRMPKVMAKQMRVASIEPLDQPSAAQRRYTVWVDVQLKPGCDGWMQPGPFASLTRETPDGPWLIQGFFTGP